MKTGKVITRDVDVLSTHRDVLYDRLKFLKGKPYNKYQNAEKLALAFVVEMLDARVESIEAARANYVAYLAKKELHDSGSDDGDKQSD